MNHHLLCTTVAKNLIYSRPALQSQWGRHSQQENSPGKGAQLNEKRMLQQGMYDEKELNHIESSLNKDSGGCTSNTAGTAYLFEIDHLKPTHLKFEKLEGQDARRLEPHQCKNHFIATTRTFTMLEARVMLLSLLSWFMEKQPGEVELLSLSPPI